MSCGVGCRRGSNPTLLWLWCRPVPTAPIRPLAWKPPYTVGAGLEKAKRQKKKTKQNKTKKTNQTKQNKTKKLYVSPSYSMLQKMIYKFHQ